LRWPCPPCPGRAAEKRTIGATRVSGVAEVLQAVGLRDLLAAADLVVTGEGSFDWQSLQGKVVAGVAGLALETATPSVVLAGQTLVGRREGCVELFIEKERHGEVPEAVVPLIRCRDVPGLRDARGRHPVGVDEVEQDSAGRM